MGGRKTQNALSLLMFLMAVEAVGDGVGEVHGSCLAVLECVNV